MYSVNSYTPLKILRVVTRCRGQGWHPTNMVVFFLKKKEEKGSQQLNVALFSLNTASDSSKYSVM